MTALDTRGAPHRVVVVGGGAGGLEMATRLGDTLGRRGRAHVTLVDRARTHLGGTPKPWRYRDFGSLVSLGEHSTVGSLMGALLGGLRTANIPIAKQEESDGHDRTDQRELRGDGDA